jgi:periplasmic protein TonB
VLRLTSSGATLCAFGFSAVVHAALLLAPMGHPSPGRGPGAEIISVDLLTDPEPLRDAPEPAPTVPPPAGRATIWPAHTHPYPVPPDHDWTPHDPNLQHVAVPPAPDAPAAAAPVETARDDTPSFTLAVGTGEGDAHGPVSSSGVAPSHEGPTLPLAEQDVDGRARLVRGVAPAYPASARADGVEGDVRLELVVGLAGSVESARVTRGVGHGLDEAALRAVNQFRFAPATQGGHAVRVRMGWSMQFRLQ